MTSGKLSQSFLRSISTTSLPSACCCKKCGNYIYTTSVKGQVYPRHIKCWKLQNIDGDCHRDPNKASPEQMKDRSTIIDGKTFKNPTYEHFRPFVEFLLSDVSERNNAPEQDDGLLIDDEDNRQEINIQKKQVLEEIQGVFDKMGLSPNSGKDKQFKARITEKVFYTTSGTKINAMSVDQLRDAHDRLCQDEEVLTRLAEVEVK